MKIITGNTMMGASGPNHAPGAAPDPGATAGTTRFLREDASFARVTAADVDTSVPNTWTGLQTFVPKINLQDNSGNSGAIGWSTGTFSIASQPLAGNAAAMSLGGPSTGVGIGSTIFAVAAEVSNTLEAFVGITSYRACGWVESTVGSFLNSSNTVEYQVGAVKGGAVPTAGFAIGDNAITLQKATVFGSTVTLNADPTANLQAATKQYVDAHAGGISAKGKATLVAGTVTVSSAFASSSAIILLTNGAPSAAIGALSIGAIVAGTSFAINSTSNLDTSTINWTILA